MPQSVILKRSLFFSISWNKYSALKPSKGTWYTKFALNSLISEAFGNTAFTKSTIWWIKVERSSVYSSSEFSI